MSRREIAVNGLLGALMLFLFAIPFILLVVDAGLLFRVLAPTVEQYFSRLALPDWFWAMALLSVFLLWTLSPRRLQGKLTVPVLRWLSFRTLFTLSFIHG